MPQVLNLSELNLSRLYGFVQDFAVIGLATLVGSSHVLENGKAR